MSRWPPMSRRNIRRRPTVGGHGMGAVQTRGRGMAGICAFPSFTEFPRHCVVFARLRSEPGARGKVKVSLTPTSTCDCLFSANCRALTRRPRGKPSRSSANPSRSHSEALCPKDFPGHWREGAAQAEGDAFRQAGHQPVTTLHISHPACLAHDMGEGHPEQPDRLRAIERALESEVTPIQVAWRQLRTHHHGRRENQIPIALAAHPAPNFPRLRALALFGRRSP